MATRIRRHLPALGLVLLVAFALRAAWVAYAHPDPTDGRLDDTAWYWWAAHYFANGDGYVNPLTGVPTAAWPPGYPAFLAGVFVAFGEGLPQAYVANAVLSTLTVAAVYVLALALFDKRVALVAAGGLALWPGQIYFTSLAMSESLFTLLFVVALLLIVASRGARHGYLGVVALGALTGLAALTRGHAFLLIPIAAVTWMAAGMPRREALRRTAIATIAAGLVLAPWVARNVDVFGRPVLVSNNTGHNVWIGHNDAATGRIPPWNIERPLPARGDMNDAEYEAAADALQLREGLTYMATHPLRELELAGAKVRALYESDASGLDWNARFGHGFFSSDDVEQRLRDLANGYWFVMLTLGGIGLFIARGRLTSDIIMLPAIVAGWTAMHVIFYGDPRYHYPMVFVVAIFAARGILTLAELALRPLPRLARRYAPA